VHIHCIRVCTRSQLFPVVSGWLPLPYDGCVMVVAATSMPQGLLPI
jgi:hypothetical protein